MKDRDLQYVVVTAEALDGLRRRQSRDPRVRRFGRLKELYEELSTLVEGLAEVPAGELAAELRSVAGTCDRRPERRLLSLLVLNCRPVWDGRPRAVFDALLAALEPDDELRRDLCHAVVEGNLPDRDGLLSPALTTFVPQLLELSPDELDGADDLDELLLETGATAEDLEAGRAAQLELLEAMGCLGWLGASDMLPRYAVPWLARLGEDADALTRRVVGDLSAGRVEGPPSGRSAAVWLGVLDLVEDRGAELGDGLVEEVVATAREYPVAVVRRRAYEVAAALLDASVVERGLDDRDRGVRDRCERLLHGGSARGGATPTLPWG